MEKYGFVYIWYDKKRKMFYIGSHWGTEDDGYICSSNRMREAYRRRPNDFKRRIVSRIYCNRLNLLEEEHKWLQLIPLIDLGKKYYNLRQHKWGSWASDDDKKKSVGLKISESRRGKKYGPRSEETKQKIREANLGKKLSSETIQKLREANLGKTISEEQKQAISNATKGIPRSEETKMKISNANSGKIRSEETKKKLRDNHVGMTGKKHSEETKQKMREARMK
jgi:hypothetical protein